MEYQNTINLLDNIPNEPSKFRTKNWKNDDMRATFNKDSQIEIKISSLCDYSDA